MFAVHLTWTAVSKPLKHFLEHYQTMKSTLYFEQALVPARSIALRELMELFLKYHPNFNKSDAYEMKKAFQILLDLFPDDEPKPDTATFKVGYMVKYQRRLIEMGYARSQINRLFCAVKRVFVWGGQPRFDLETCDKLPAIVSNTFIADLMGIKSVTDEGKENPPRKDVPEKVVTAIFPYVSETIADMLRLQLLTGMRPHEVCAMRMGDLKQTKEEFMEHGLLYDGESWLYVLDEHKTKKHIGTKVIPLGIQEQEILSKYLDNSDYLINSDLWSPIFKNSMGNAMTREAYGRNIKDAIERNGLQKFVPYQIRHTSLTEVSFEHGRDVARAVAGHTTEKMTARYDHSDYRKALAVVKERNKIYKEKKAMGSLGSPDSLDVPVLRIFTGE
jgi:integrase